MVSRTGTLIPCKRLTDLLRFNISLISGYRSDGKVRKLEAKEDNERNEVCSNPGKRRELYRTRGYGGVETSQTIKTQLRGGTSGHVWVDLSVRVCVCV